MLDATRYLQSHLTLIRHEKKTEENSNEDWLAFAPMFQYLIFICELYSAIWWEVNLQLSFGPIGWLMISEIFPLRLRGRGLSIAVLVNFASNALVTFAFSPLEVRACCLFSAFAMECTWTCICLLEPIESYFTVLSVLWCRIWLELGSSSLDSGWLQ